MTAGERQRPLPVSARRRRSLVLQGVLVLTAALAAPQAVADWLVLRDGSKVETAGAWRVDGRLVVFELKGGQLASLRLDEVELRASEEATAAARAAAAAPVAHAPSPRPKAKIVLTDADIPKGAVQPLGAEGDDAEGDEAAADGKDASSGSAGGGDDLVVLSWESVDSAAGDGLQIYGVAQNQGRDTLTGAGIRVLLYDADGGEPIATAEADLSRTELPSRARTNFSVGFPGVFAFSAAKFEPRHRAFEARRAPAGDEVDLEEPPGPPPTL